jgi:hypothetical protein
MQPEVGTEAVFPPIVLGKKPTLAMAGMCFESQIDAIYKANPESQGFNSS